MAKLFLYMSIVCVVGCVYGVLCNDVAFALLNVSFALIWLIAHAFAK